MGALKVMTRLGDTKTNQFSNINKTEAPQRYYSLGNNHITTANFGDLIPGYWCEARPRDKFELDANILAKFMALLAPAYTKADITVDWFFVPTKLISPRSLEFLQNGPLVDVSSQTNNVFDVNSTLYGETYTKKKTEHDDQFEFIGIPRFDCSMISDYLCSGNGTAINSNDDLTGLSYYQRINAAWRSTESAKGLEDLNCFGNKYNVSRLLDYMGLPKSVSTYKYAAESSLLIGMPQTLNGMDSIQITVNSQAQLVDPATSTIDYYLLNPEYLKLCGNSIQLATSYFFQQSVSAQVRNVYMTKLDYSGSITSTVSNDQRNQYCEFNWSGSQYDRYNSLKTCPQHIDIDVRPFLAYQKIYNDYYRDPVKQDPIRLYPDFVGFALPGGSLHSDEIFNAPTRTMLKMRRFINNVFSLRRRNYDKDWLNNSLLTTQLQSQVNVNYQPFNSRFLNNAYKYALKKAVTGNRYFDWLANFMDASGNDFLTNNVTYIGGSRFPITISETLQTSSTDDVSPQGNRSGNMNAYQNTDKYYFSAPDFGYIFCIVSLLPRISYFNGISQRFRNLTVLSQNLPDFQNIGFQSVSSDELRVSRSAEPNVFGYLPIGYQHKFVPNMITGDFSKSLNYWHQSPDLTDPANVSYNLQAIDANSSVLDILSAFLGSDALKPYPNSANFPAVGLQQVSNNLQSVNYYYNNPFAVTTDGSGDHAQLTMDFYVTCSRAMSEPELLVDDSLI